MKVGDDLSLNHSAGRAWSKKPSIVWRMRTATCFEIFALADMLINPNNRCRGGGEVDQNLTTVLKVKNTQVKVNIKRLISVAERPCSRTHSVAKNMNNENPRHIPLFVSARSCKYEDDPEQVQRTVENARKTQRDKSRLGQRKGGN